MHVFIITKKSESLMARAFFTLKKGIPNSLRDAFSCSFVCAGYAMTAGATTRL